MFVMMKHYQVHSEKTRQGQGVQNKTLDAAKQNVYLRDRCLKYINDIS